MCRDLWYGLAARTKDGSLTKYANASFAYVSSYLPTPLVAPNDVNGDVDKCVATGSVVSAVSQTVGSSIRSVTFKNLAQNVPYSVFVYENQTVGSLVRCNVTVPFVYARPMPPRAYAITAWYDSSQFRSGSTPVTTLLSSPTATVLDIWPDSSGRGHHLTATGSRRPTVITSTTSTMAVAFTRASAQWMATGADAIDLGVSTAFAVYSHASYSSSSQGFIAGRGIQKSTSDYGWGFFTYSDANIGWPGLTGVRTTEVKGTQAAIGGNNVARNGMIQQGVHVVMFSDNVTVTPDSTRLYPFYPKYMTMSHNPEFSTMVASSSFPGFTDGFALNVSKLNTPLSINWTTTGASPSISSNLAFHIGGPMDASGDTFHSISSSVYSIVLYREAHDSATRLSIQNWLDWYQYRRCYVVTSNTVISSSCTNGIRDDHCTQKCKTGYAQVAGTNDLCTCAMYYMLMMYNCLYVDCVCVCVQIVVVVPGPLPRVCVNGSVTHSRPPHSTRRASNTYLQTTSLMQQRVGFVM
jgi:hypothetical protein